ncbi:DNA-binding response OmpR family regulator [Pseudochelatococcus lubricantis]|uniref:DNA-binding response OmpR family regulator n=1 Tax=Pseudochelatococcus lubricantis TaxID=1538102 RepID=A0ABX0V2W6_9HYPH|nr:response regulator [Pseudochelatococcus lubricantis]NIJ58165.1 DNA-binding response OmpR family regulator [Pseudochelatococcus lubricantis]
MARILLVDDEASVRGFLKRGLELDGHDVETAGDGAEGLDTLTAARGAFDLLLTDVRMPLMDGIALAQEAAAQWPDLVILIMTGYSDQHERAQGLTNLAGILLKPFTLGELRAHVAQALG